MYVTINWNKNDKKRQQIMINMEVDSKILDSAQTWLRQKMERRRLGRRQLLRWWGHLGQSGEKGKQI